MTKLMKIKDEEYFTRPEISNSDLSYVLLGQHQFIDYKLNGSKSTGAKTIGSVYHHNVLEPNEQMKGIIGEDDFIKNNPEALKDGQPNRRVKVYQDWKKLQISQGVEIYEASDFVTVREMTNNTKNFPWVKEMLSHPESKNEYAIIFEDSGVECRAKIDHLHELDDVNIVIDLKSIEVREGLTLSEAIRMSIRKYHYHRQAAFYMRAATALNGKPSIFWFVFQEKSYPFGVIVCSLDANYIHAGNIEIDRALEAYKAFPAELPKYPYGTEPQIIGAPEWLIKQNEMEE